MEISKATPFLVVVGFCLALSLLSSTALAVWWNESCNYRRAIPFQYIGSNSTLTNYQVLINVTRNDNMVDAENWVRDLWFVNASDGAKIEFWNMSQTNNYADIWLKIPRISNTANTTIDMYYNCTGRSMPNGDATFVFFDDFLGTSLNTTRWSNVGTIGSVSVGNGALLIDTPSGTAGYRSVHSISQFAVGSGKKLYYMLNTSIDWTGGGVLDRDAQACWGFCIRTASGWLNTDFAGHGYTDTGANGNDRIRNANGAASQQITSDFFNSTIRQIFYIRYNSTRASFFNETASQGSFTTLLTTTLPIGWNEDRTPDALAQKHHIWWVALGEWVDAEPTYSIGSEQLLDLGPPPIITIASPLNQTYYAVTSNLLNFSVYDDKTTSLPCWYRVNGGVEIATGNITNNTYWSTTLTNLFGGSHNVTIKCQDNKPQNATVNQYWYNWHGFYNISTFNAGNYSAITNWRIYVNNTTSSYSAVNLSNPTSIVWSALPQGDVSIKINHSIFKEESYGVFNVNSSMGILNLTAYLWRLQEFQAKNLDTGLAISDFNIFFSNTSYNYSESTTTGKIVTSLANLPFGTAVSLKFTASGFNTTTFYENINGSSELNTSYNLKPASLYIKVFDEEAITRNITFNVTIINSTNTSKWYQQTEFYQYWGNLPYGDVKIDIVPYNLTNSNYAQRSYFTNINKNTAIKLYAYLLSNTKGIWVRFHIRTALDNPVANATCSVQSFLNVSWLTVGQAKSDDSGVCLFFLNPLVSYKLKVEHTDYITQYATIQPTETDYRVYLKTPEKLGFSTIFTDISISLEPTTYSLNMTNQTITCIVSSSQSELQYVGLNITHNTSIPLYYLLVDTSPSGTEISVILDLTNKTGNITANCFFKRTSFDQFNLTRTYQIYNVTYSPISIPQLLIGFSGLGISPFVQGLIALLTTGLIGGFIGRHSVVAGAVAGLLILSIFTFYLGFIDWKIFMLLALAVGSIIMIKSGF